MTSTRRPPTVLAAINNAAATLPPDLPAPPVYSKVNPSDKSIIKIVLKSSALSPGDLYDIGFNRVAQRISMLEGVSQVSFWGSLAAVRIDLDLAKLNALKIGINEVAAALKTGTIEKPGGFLDRASAFSIVPEGQLTKAAHYDELIVAYRPGGPVRLKDIGKARDSLQNDQVNAIYWKDGEKEENGVMVIIVRRRPESNTVELVHRIESLLKEVKTNLPAEVDIELLYDRVTMIIASIRDVLFTLCLTFILVVLVIFIFIGRVSETVVPGVALPLSIVMSFIVMQLCGFSLDNLSLMAITLAVGFVVDNAIVVLENNVRLVEGRMEPFEAAQRSAREISGTVVAMSLTLATVFVPLIFMGGIIGLTFRAFGLTVVIVIVCSGVVSLTLSPMMCARMISSAKDGRTRTSLLQRVVSRLMGGMLSSYGVALRMSLRHRHATVLIGSGCVAGSVWLAVLVPKDFLPVGDSGVIFGGLLTPLGTSTERMRLFQEKVNDIFKSLAGGRPFRHRHRNVVWRGPDHWRRRDRSQGSVSTAADGRGGPLASRQIRAHGFPAREGVPRSHAGLAGGDGRTAHGVRNRVLLHDTGGRPRGAVRPRQGFKLRAHRRGRGAWAEPGLRWRENHPVHNGSQ